MIIRESGAVRIGGALEVPPTASPGDVRDLPLESRCDTWTDRDENEWTRISLDPHRCMNRLIAATFVFCKGTLHRSSFAMVGEPFGGLDWSDWSEERELDRKKAHDRLLDEVLGKERSFAWGEVWSEYDPRSGGSEFGINYREG